jgi:Glycosyl hydrolase family 26
MARHIGSSAAPPGRAPRQRWRAALVAALVLAAAAGYGLWPDGGGPSAHRPVRQEPPAVRPAHVRPATVPCTVSSILVPSCGAWWGMYVPEPPGESLTGAVRAEEGYLGRPLGIIENYHDMSDTANGIFPTSAEAKLARTHILLYSWAPADWSRHLRFKWQEIAAGNLDQSVIVPEAERLKALHHPVFLSFSPEADSSSAVHLGTPADFVAAWRHIHNVFAQLGVHNVIWVWTTEGYLPHASTIAALYPGNRYVDWIAYDPYNFFTCHRTSWLTFAQTVEPFYRWLAAHQLGSKPIMLAEYGSQADPWNPYREAAWFRSIGPTVRALPRIKALVEWNYNVPGCNLQLMDGTPAAEAYRQAGLSPYFQPRLP